MNRLYCLAIALSTFVLTSYLSGQSTRSLRPAEMNALRGGNGQSAKWTSRCDMYTKQYIGCTKAGVVCQQCAKKNEGDDPVPTKIDFLNNPSWPDNPGGYEPKLGLQDCGNIWMGTCVADPSSPTGFTCEAHDTKIQCPTDSKVGLQPD